LELPQSVFFMLMQSGTGRQPGTQIGWRPRSRRDTIRMYSEERRFDRDRAATAITIMPPADRRLLSRHADADDPSGATHRGLTPPQHQRGVPMYMRRPD